MVKTVQRCSDQSECMLQDCFDHADWEMFSVASGNSIDVYSNSVTGFVKKRIEDVVPTVTIRTHPNQKPWIDGIIHAKLNGKTTTFNHTKVTGNMDVYKKVSYDLHKPIKEAKRQYRDKVESQFNGSDTRCMWQGLEKITDCKGKASHVMDTGASLPDKRNTFFARFEENTEPPMLALTAHEDCMLPISVAEASKTFKCVNPPACKAAGPDDIPSRVLRECTDQLSGVFRDIFNLSLCLFDCLTEGITTLFVFPVTLPWLNAVVHAFSLGRMLPSIHGFFIRSSL